MGGTIDFAAIPYVCEIYGVEDVETMLADLVAIREHKRPKANG